MALLRDIHILVSKECLKQTGWKSVWEKTGVSFGDAKNYSRLVRKLRIRKRIRVGLDWMKIRKSIRNSFSFKACGLCTDLMQYWFFSIKKKTSFLVWSVCYDWPVLTFCVTTYVYGTFEVLEAHVFNWKFLCAFFSFSFL